MQMHSAPPRCRQSGTSLSYCSISLGQDKPSYRGWLCLFFFFGIFLLCPCINVYGEALTWVVSVYQCDLEALVDLFKEHVVSCAVYVHLHAH